MKWAPCPRQNKAQMDAALQFKTRREWLSLLQRCQNGEATCLYVLHEIEREGLLEEERQAILGCIDTLGTVLADHKHQWTDGERAIYEEACRLLGRPEQEPPEIPTEERPC